MGRLISLLLGAAIGAGGALLLAPQRQGQVRDDLRRRLDDARERTTDALAKSRIRVTELVNSGLDTVDQSLARGQAAVSNRIDQARTNLGNLDARAHEARRTASDAIESVKTDIERTPE